MYNTFMYSICMYVTYIHRYSMYSCIYIYTSIFKEMYVIYVYIVYAHYICIYTIIHVCVIALL